MTDPAAPMEARFIVNITPEVEVGVFANFVSLWHDKESFTLDFATVTAPPQPVHDDETGDDFIQVQTRIVSRVRIPPSQVFEIMKALEQQLTAWENETGNKPSGPTDISN